MDIRYADRIHDENQDLIYGFDLNNNPGVQDVWNSAPAWGYSNVVPISTGEGTAITPQISGALGSQAVGTGAYLYWDKTVYAEISGYRTGDGVFSFATWGNGGQTYIKGENPYLRLALTHEWGAQNVMIGYSYFDVEQYTDSTRTLFNHFRDNSVDFQYQYLLDPHTFTAEIIRTNETVNYGDAGSAPDTVNSLMAKASYTYEAKYGAALSYFNISNSSNNAPGGTVNPGLASATEMPGQAGTEGWTPEIFYLPIQNVRLGVQYTMFDKVNGVSSGPATGTYNNKASGDNTVVFYAWFAFGN